MKAINGLIAVLLIASGVAYANSEDCREGYPPSWWEPVSRDDAPDWEVLPQDAGPCELVLSKRDVGGLALLSNFAETHFRFEGRSYKSLEGFWQMMKYPEGRYDPRARRRDLEWPYSRREVSQMVGFDAKRAGKAGSRNMETMGINWVSYRGSRMTYRTTERGEHYHLIRAAMLKKLEQNPAVRDILLRTGDLTLIPDHGQGDNPPPAWQYHNIWTEIRSEIRANAE